MKALGFPEVFGVFSNSYFLKPSTTTRGHAQDLRGAAAQVKFEELKLSPGTCGLFFQCKIFSSIFSRFDELKNLGVPNTENL